MKFDGLVAAAVLLAGHVRNVYSVVLPHLLVLHVNALVLRGRNFARTPLEVVFAVFGLVVLVLELYWSISVRPRRDWEVGAAGYIMVLIYLLGGVGCLAQFAAEFVWLARDLRLLAVLRGLGVNLGRVALVVGEGLVAGADRLLDDEPASVVAVAFLSQRGRVHLAAGSPRIDGMLLDHLVEHAVAAALDDRTVVVSDSAGSRSGTSVLGILEEAADIGIVLRRYQLGLHGVSYRLVAVVSDRGGVLDAVRDDSSYSVGVNGGAAAHEFEGAGEVQVTKKEKKLVNFEI